MPDIKTTLAARQSTHGSFKESAVTVQRLKTVMRAAPNWELLSGSQKEALEMIQHKIGRILHGDPNFHDNWHDIIGYTKLIEDQLESPDDNNK